MTKSLRSIIGDRSLNDLFSAWQPVVVDPMENDWLDLPSQEFLDFARTYPNNEMWNIPPQDTYIKQPNFLISQVHRVWLSARLTKKISSENDRILDLGSFPFVVPVAMRQFFQHKGSISTSVIQPLGKSSIDLLDGLGIGFEQLDLDPYVFDAARGDRLPTRLQVRDGSQDVCTLFHVIEHLYHPIPVLKEIHRVLKENGKLIITTDNANMLDVFQNLVSNYGYIFEPVESTAAMSVHDWRGHVRFFTDSDLRTMLESSGFRIVEIGFREVFYDVIFEEYFKNKDISIPNWRIDIIKNHPEFRNDIFVVAEKI